MARAEGGAYGLPWALRGPRRRLGRIRRLDGGQRARAGLGPVGMLRCGPGVEPGPSRLAHRAQPTLGRLEGSLTTGGTFQNAIFQLESPVAVATDFSSIGCGEFFGDFPTRGGGGPGAA